VRAKAVVSEMEAEGLTLVHDIRNTTDACYAAWPERLYVIGTDGRITYKSGMGPFKFEPDELEEFLESSIGSAGRDRPLRALRAIQQRSRTSARRFPH
jgi:hypothetical protein